MRQLEQKAVTLLESCGDIIVTSINEAGYPRPCVLSKLGAQELKAIYFSTGSDSKKTAHFKKNPKAGLCFYREHDSVTMVGEIEIVTDPEMKSSLWQDWMIEHFTGGPQDENYCVLCFRPREATIWIEGKFVTFHYDR